MNWHVVLRYAILVGLFCFWGCSKESQTTVDQSPPAKAEQAVVDASTTPGAFQAASTPLKDIATETQANSNEGVADQSNSPATDNESIAQTSAVEPATDPGPKTTDTTIGLTGPINPAAPPAPIDVPATNDPVRRNASDPPQKSGHNEIRREPLFVDWPTPAVAMVLTGRQYGYMEPCGCSGLENQNGGLVRRNTLIRQLKDKGWPVIPIDAGNQVRRFGRQAEIKFQFTAQSLGEMGYEAVSFGPDDLRLPTTALVGVITNARGDEKIFVSANADIFGEPTMFSLPFRVIERGGKKIGITAVLGERNRKLVNNDEVVMRPADEGIKRIWPQMQRANCDLYVLIAHATMEESVALGKDFPQFRVVVTTGGAGEPTRQPEMIPNTKQWLIQVGTKGMFAGVVALFDDARTPLRYQRIPLDARFPDSKEMLQLLAAYQDQLKIAGFEGLEIREQPLPGGLKFVGSEVCNDCHGAEYEIWKEGAGGHSDKHAHAYATLEHPPNSRGGIPRNFDPECLSCHVVGWNPQKYFPYKSGFLNLKDTPHLTDVGCENCHGPGSKHVAAENGDLDIDEDELDEIREAMWLDLKDAENKCLECHDLDNSPDFQEEGAFERYWKKIEH